MAVLSGIKNTVLCWLLILSACGNHDRKATHLGSTTEVDPPVAKEATIVVGANRIPEYLPLLKTKKLAVVANQTSVIFKTSIDNTPDFTHLVDSLRSLNLDIKKVFAPEHGFRGEADAGEHVT
ncbi:MAG: DUF1343 domain-containing protein, partial [Eudoraea sp.]|nr:DUF1343 domain-containing protein [Eudoraea sp.]